MYCANRSGCADVGIAACGVCVYRLLGVLKLGVFLFVVKLRCQLCMWFLLFILQSPSHVLPSEYRVFVYVKQWVFMCRTVYEWQLSMCVVFFKLVWFCCCSETNDCRGDYGVESPVLVCAFVVLCCYKSKICIINSELCEHVCWGLSCSLNLYCKWRFGMLINYMLLE